VYKGEFQCGFKHGKGKMIYASGNYYEGSWKFDKKCGYGEMRWLTTNEIYKGYWEENLQNGFGIHLWLEEPGKLKSMRNRYEGMWFNGLRNGYGTFYYSDGSRYDGEWVSNMKEGFAVFTDPSGDIMEAIFKNDRLFQRLNQPRKIDMPSLVPEVSEEYDEPNLKKAAQKVKSGRTSVSVVATPSATQPVKPTRSRKNNNPLPDQTIILSKEQEFAKRNLENQVLNPYLQLLRVDDLLETVQDKDEVLSNLEISLLHHNSTLMDIFKEYKAFRSNINELSCTMTLKSMWQFLRNSRIQSPVLSLANFNRYFYENPHNIYDMHYDFKDLRTKVKKLKLAHYSSNPRKLEVLKKLDVYIRKDDVQFTFKKLDYDNFEWSLKEVDEHHWAQLEEDQHEKALSEQMAGMNIKKFSIHDPLNVVHFRNFIDGLIRAIYIRENFSFANIGDDLSKKYMKMRIEPIVHNKNFIIDKPYGAEEEEKLAGFIDDYLLLSDENLKTIFRKNLSLRCSQTDDIEQQMSDVASLHAFLTRAKLIRDSTDEIKFFRVAERYFDPDSSYIELLVKKIELDRHFNRMQSLELAGASQYAESMELDISQASRELMSKRTHQASPPVLDDPKNLPNTLMLSNADIGFTNIEEEDSKAEKPGTEFFIDANFQPLSLKNLNMELSYDPEANNEDLKAISRRLNCLLGHELLFFEFVEDLLLYLLVTVS
jgi:hypothetical protein